MAKKEKPVWIHTEAMLELSKALSAEELGVAMDLLASMWSAGETAIAANLEALFLRLRLTKRDKHITVSWMTDHWPNISRIFFRRSDGLFAANPIIFAPASDEPPEEGCG